MRSAERAPAPAVSVIVLNYNGARFIGKCLDHLLAQTFADYDILLVDNASTDDSKHVIRGYEKHDRVRALWAQRNHGVAGGRNVGLENARGGIVAFIDNDGYADPDWLANAVPCFEEESVGAVASLVFFRRKRMIVNGAGGTLNLRGYGGDHCFHTSYEFADIPTDVLYPMGCGMMVRRSTLDQIGPFDEVIFNYYDDVELGISVWNAGKRVIVCPDAWVDHEYGSSTTTSHQKVYLCERNRIRTVLKYFPLRQLPLWLLREIEILRYLRLKGLRDVPLRAWAWNLRHLASAVSRRRRMDLHPARYWPLIAQTGRQYPSPLPDEHAPEAETVPAAKHVRVGNGTEAASLLFGWYPAEHDGRHAFRWAAPVASVVLKTDERTAHIEIAAISPRSGQTVRLVARRLGEIDGVWHGLLAPLSTTWSTQKVDCDLEPGIYELLLLSDRREVDRLGRPLGFGLAALELLSGVPSSADHDSTVER